MGMGSLVFLVVIAALVFYVVAIYNRLVTLKNRYQNSFSQIDVQLKRRYDLIPNLVETAKAYLEHERGTLEAVIAARNEAMAGLKAAAADPGSAQALSQLARAEGGLQGALGKLSIVVEAYPDLKADANMRQLSEELTSTENRVAFSRQAFNDAVTEYNSYKQSFPPVLLAGTFGHVRDASLLEFADREQLQVVPKVSF
ncbi:LemA family protein [Amphritea sp.]|uniref:LemA family protein n=1 Tax=Amphritea sp. TaxID=1872502 RepID=UPI00356421EF